MRKLTVTRDDEFLDDFDDEIEDGKPEEDEWDHFEEEERHDAARDFIRSPHK